LYPFIVKDRAAGLSHGDAASAILDGSTRNLAPFGPLRRKAALLAEMLSLQTMPISVLALTA